jgi:hypothetical protein
LPQRRAHPFIGINIDDPFAGGLFQGKLLLRAEPHERAMDHPCPKIFGDLNRAVRGPAVDDNNFIGHPLEAFQTAREVPFFVTDNEDCGQFCHLVHSCSCPLHGTLLT